MNVARAPGYTQRNTAGIGVGMQTCPGIQAQQIKSGILRHDPSHSKQQQLPRVECSCVGNPRWSRAGEQVSCRPYSAAVTRTGLPFQQISLHADTHREGIDTGLSSLFCCPCRGAQRREVMRGRKQLESCSPSGLKCAR
ncbi:hypothetical protein MHYP_G00326840 [Metynnis hypsauchen]